METLWHDPLVVTILRTSLLFAGLCLGFVLPLAALLTWMERRQSALSQDRLGPTRAHFMTVFGRAVTLFGLLHIIADAVKMFFKENHKPASPYPFAYQIAPAIGFVSALVVMSLIPFGPVWHTSWAGPWESIRLQVAPVPSSLLWIFAFGSLGVYGAALAGFCSNNRFAILGGLRASAQTISYEIALGLTAVGLMIAFGSTDLFTFVERQQEAVLFGWLPAWGIVLQPLGAVLFFIAAMAETKRAPFDLPEGESEIVGYFVEYSSMGFGLFMLSEFVEVVVLAALFTTLFLGGWHLPGLSPEMFSPGYYALLSVGVFIVKVFLLCVLQLQIRWTLPRFRYDQLMQVGWKMLLPWALVNIVLTAGAVVLRPDLKLLAGFGLLQVLLFMVLVAAGPTPARVER